MRFLVPNVNRALIFQGGGSLGAYEAGCNKAAKEVLSDYFKSEGRENDTIFHIVSGTSMTVYLLNLSKYGLLVSLFYFCHGCTYQKKMTVLADKARRSIGNKSSRLT